MKVVHVFNHDDYHRTLNPNEQKRIHYQRGGGLGGAFGTIKRYSIPVIRQYVIPSARAAAINTARDIFAGQNVRSAIKSNAVSLVKNVGKDMYNSLVQKGKGIAKRGRPAKTTVVVKKQTKRKSAGKQKSRKNTSGTKKKKKVQSKSKRDIFS